MDVNRRQRAEKVHEYFQSYTGRQLKEILFISGVIAGAFGLAFIFATNMSKGIQERCKKEDCRSSQEKLEQAKTDEEAKAICDKEFGGRVEEDAPIRCLKLYKLK